MNMLQSSKSTSPAYTLFKKYYRSFLRKDLDKIDDIYDSDAIFKDPLNEVRGVSAIHCYRNNFCRSFSDFRVEFIDECIAMDRAYLKWNMYFKYKNKQRVYSVRGVTQLLFGEKIVYHEDIYNIGDMFYGKMPLVGNLAQTMMKKFANKPEQAHK